MEPKGYWKRFRSALGMVIIVRLFFGSPQRGISTQSFVDFIVERQIANHDKFVSLGGEQFVLLLPGMRSQA